MSTGLIPHEYQGLVLALASDAGNPARQMLLTDFVLGYTCGWVTAITDPRAVNPPTQNQPEVA